MGRDRLRGFTTCDQLKAARTSWHPTHLWANVTGSGHAVLEVEEVYLVFSVETAARETSKEGLDQIKRNLSPVTVTNAVLTLEI